MKKILLILLLSSCSVIHKTTSDHDHHKVCKKICNCATEDCCVVYDFELYPEEKFQANEKGDTVWRFEVIY
tara:strand:+ start:297 stop:509 length:213 start_codon:yes stop_codon:yes gene_type:complete